MARLNYNNNRELDLSAHDGIYQATMWVKPASTESIKTVLTADENDEDGRSEWLWVRFPNGDLMLATFPQGSTYFETEMDHTP